MHEFLLNDAEIAKLQFSMGNEVEVTGGVLIPPESQNLIKAQARKMLAYIRANGHPVAGDWGHEEGWQIDDEPWKILLKELEGI